MTLRTVDRDRVRMGVVGCGVVSDYGHIPTIAASPLAELVAFADPDPARLRKQVSRYDRPGYASFEEMLSKEDLDAVAIPTHPDIKLSLVRLAADHGLHAFCEKPLTEDISEAEALVELMASRGLFVGVSFVYRGKQIVQRMVDLVVEGAIGKLRAVHLQNLWDYHGLRDEAVRGKRRRRALENLGTLDCGVHHLDLARYLSGGEYETLHAVGDIVEPENRYPDHILVNARMDNGVLVSIEESAVWGHTAADRPAYAQHYRLIGERGVLSANVGDHAGPDETCPLYIVSEGRQWTESVSAGKSWEPTYQQFFKTILGKPIDRPFVASGHDGLINMQIARRIIDLCRSTSRISP